MNSSAPVPTPIEVALERYQTALNYLGTSNNKSLEKEQALEILAARDALQKQLEAEAEIPVDMWAKLIKQREFDEHFVVNREHQTYAGSSIPQGLVLWI
jgi:hypothetical protein